VVWMDFSITLPETAEAVSGHCVLIPCQFKIGSDYTHLLKNTSVGKWLKNGTELKNIVFDSSTPDNNQIKGKITGDLSEKNCTTIFTSISPESSGKYYFRIEGEGKLKWSYKEPHVSISVSSPPKPTLSLNVDQKEVKNLENVMEGSSVNLICSALDPCSSNPPNLTWTNVPSIISVQEIQNTTFISSHLSFTASHLHDGDQITCTASYQLEDKSIKSVSSSRLLLVLSPQASLSSHCNSSDGGILCVCEVYGFPVPKLEWRLSGRSVSSSVNRSIREEHIGSTGLRSLITIVPLTDMPTLQCIGSNNLGSTNQQFVLFGAAVGASAVMLLCIIYVCG
uniref:Ig-like domain-containing protein n=1 Tax=Astyanax mexicanus TaxID=7994 RepID=A0A3B1JGR1_ASTMX